MTPTDPRPDPLAALTTSRERDIRRRAEIGGNVSAKMARELFEALDEARSFATDYATALNDCRAAARLRAAGVDTRAAVLDVERLARVFAAHFGPSYFPNMTDVTIHGSSPEEIAEQVAREYRESGS